MTVSQRANRVWDTSEATGTGVLTLLGAATTRFRSFAQAFPSANINIVYTAVHRTAVEWETGLGILNADAGTITRTTVLDNHLGTTGLVNFSAGTKDVFQNIAAERLITLDDDGAGLTMPGRRLMTPDGVVHCTKLAKLVPAVNQGEPVPLISLAIIGGSSGAGVSAMLRFSLLVTANSSTLGGKNSSSSMSEYLVAITRHASALAVVTMKAVQLTGGVALVSAVMPGNDALASTPILDVSAIAGGSGVNTCDIEMVVSAAPGNADSLAIVVAELTHGYVNNSVELITMS